MDIDQINYRKKLIEGVKEAEHEKQVKTILEDPNTPSNLKKLLEMTREKGTGAWLTALPTEAARDFDSSEIRAFA